MKFLFVNKVKKLLPNMSDFAYQLLKLKAVETVSCCIIRFMVMVTIWYAVWILCVDLLLFPCDVVSNAGGSLGYLFSFIIKILLVHTHAISVACSLFPDTCCFHTHTRAHAQRSLIHHCVSRVFHFSSSFL